MATKRKDANRTQRRFDRRWLELTGERYRPGGRVPAPLVNSLSSLVFAPTRVEPAMGCLATAHHAGRPSTRQAHYHHVRENARCSSARLGIGR